MTGTNAGWRPQSSIDETTREQEWCEWCNGWRKPSHFDAMDNCIPSTLRDTLVEIVDELRGDEHDAIERMRAIVAEIRRVETESALPRRQL